MSTYLWMKILESTPGWYDRGVRALTLGRLERTYDRLSSWIGEGQRVLDLGCGTGALTIRAACKGAKVKGIDTSPGMLEIAARRVEESELSENVELCQMGVAELGREGTGFYDIVMSGLCLSEFTGEEIAFTLKEVERILKPGGLLLVADETRATICSKRILNWLIRLPFVVPAYLSAHGMPRPLNNLPEKVGFAGLEIVSVRSNGLESFMEVVARKPVR
ncbi:MAG: class I SAM-dependent methyltransferase [Deltaproteobacteria bacterium]|nr:class I SAM-dependent methyltransferase [Deltaproteobacteria bacterium]MBW2121146.1 class I SAM-dependent methyltransferase [Deltaproteobacteria bacterium]